MSRSATQLTFLEGRSLFPQFSLDGAKIVFTSRVNRRSDIYLMNADGSDLRPLTTSDAQFHEPIFSPDGKQIVYAAGPRMYEEIHDVWIMDADGSNQQPLTSTGRDSVARWSPDGRSIVFVSGRDKSLEIYRMCADGSDQRRLTTVADTTERRIGPPPRNHSPRYLADGEGIVFVASLLWPIESPEHHGKVGIRGREIHRMNEDGSGRTALTPPGDGCDEPEVSADGRYVAFCSSAKGHRESFRCLVHPDGGSLRRLEGSAGSYHAFHPAGDRVAFASFRDHRVEPITHNYDLYVIRIDDGRLERLTDNTDGDNLPAFSPDGKRIAFCSERDGTHEIYSIPYDG